MSESIRLLLEVVRAVELDPVPIREAAPLRFRIEILKELGEQPRFFARLCRWECFEMRPWPSEQAPGGSIEDVLIEDSFWDWKENPAASADTALDALLAKLRTQLHGE
jgi:hypothetical protein